MTHAMFKRDIFPLYKNFSGMRFFRSFNNPSVLEYCTKEKAEEDAQKMRKWFDGYVRVIKGPLNLYYVYMHGESWDKMTIAFIKIESGDIVGDGKNKPYRELTVSYRKVKSESDNVLFCWRVN